MLHVSRFLLGEVRPSFSDLLLLCQRILFIQYSSMKLSREGQEPQPDCLTQVRELADERKQPQLWSVVYSLDFSPQHIFTALVQCVRFRLLSITHLHCPVPVFMVHTSLHNASSLPGSGAYSLGFSLQIIININMLSPQP